MRVTLRRLAALGLVGALGFAAAPVKKIQFTDTKLKNGLRVIISEDHSAPVFAVAVNYNVGSRDERKGRTGFAHLFEHMMFKGSANVGAGEHPHLIFANGGTMNGTTNKDRTLYYEILPANQLDLALFLEADRMRSLDITKANLDNQRNAVQEERRLGVDNQPYGKTFEVRDELAYDNFAYKHSVIGSMADLERRDGRRRRRVLQDLLRAQQRRPRDRRRRRREGDAREGPEVLRVDSVAAGAAAGRHHRAAAERQSGARRSRTRWRGCRARHGLQDPAELVARRRCAARAGDDALERPQLALLRGIVRQKQLATDVIGVRRREPRSRPVQLRRHGAARARRRGPRSRDRRGDRASEGRADRGLGDGEGAQQRAHQLVNSLGSALDRAMTLGEDALFYNDPDRINTRADSIAKVTAADVQRVAKQYLVKTGRTVVITVPKGRAGEREAVMRTDAHRASPPLRRDAAVIATRSPAQIGRQAARVQPPSSAGLVLKGKAPVSNDILKVKLPKPQEADLPNGLHLMVLEDHRLPRVAFQIIIPGAGGYFDPPAMIGLSTYTAQMMREGTTTQTSQQISQELETMAANVTVGGSTVGPDRDRVRRRADRELAEAVRSRGRRPAESVVPGRGVGAAEDAGARRARCNSAPSRASCRRSASRRSSSATIRPAASRRRRKRSTRSHARRWSSSTARATCPITR